MSFAITLNVKDAAAAALKAYDEGRLSAQGPHPACVYRDTDGRPCAIGAALTEEQISWIVNAGLNETALDLMCTAISGEHFAKVFQSDNIERLRRLQSFHDSWAQAVKAQDPPDKLKALEEQFVNQAHKELAQ